MRTLNILLKGIAVVLVLSFAQTNSYAKSNDGDDNKKKKSEATKINKKVLKEGIDDLLYNPQLFRPTYDESPDVMGENCNMKARFKLKMKGKTVQFKNTSETAYTHVEWRFGDGTLSHDSFTTEHTYEKGGNYYFSVMVYNIYTGCLDSFTGSYHIFDQDAQRAKMKKQRRKAATKKETKNTNNKSVKNTNGSLKVIELAQVLMDTYVDETDKESLNTEEFE